MIDEPGENWVYNGGATTLIGQIIAQGTGKSMDKYAAEKLFTPLGITQYEWSAGSDGTPSAAAGLRMKASDLAKIGLMINNNGIHENMQIVPQLWLKQSFKAYAYDADSLGHGYFWWLSPADDPVKWIAGSGNGGQSLDLVKNSEYVSVIFAGNYNQPEFWKLPVKLTTEIIFPTLFPE
jgi:CubicO group peptidase (beta-lactamase class C family)